LKIKFICIGKTTKSYLKEAEEDYLARLKHYVSFERIEIQDIKNVKSGSNEQLKVAEGKEFLKRLSPSDFVVLLDEGGSEFSSVSFASFLDSHISNNTKTLVFIIGGAFGFSQEIYAYCNLKLSLSRMTFSHQMIRMLFFEQVYRAFTIIRGEAYHHK
jgi:23S rRNA (pseudouridine1915-N3)-methyltransferase